MTDSVFTGSVVVEGEVPAGCVDLACLPEQPAVPDAGGEGEHALADPGPDPFGDVAAVVLEGELALGCLVGRLDPLADAAELSEARPLVLAVRADECRVKAGDDLLELPASEALVGDDDLPAREQLLAAGAFEHRGRDLPLGLIRGRQGEADWHPVRRAQQIQPQSPEETAVALAVAVGGPAGELGAPDGLARGATRHGRGVQQPQPVTERRRGPRQTTDDHADLRREPAQSLVVPGLLGDIRKQVPKALVGKPQKPPLGMALQDDLRDRQRDELSIGDPWATACTAARRQEIVRQHVKCREQAVEVGVHEATSVVDVALATPTFDSLTTTPRRAPTAPVNSESVI